MTIKKCLIKIHVYLVLKNSAERACKKLVLSFNKPEMKGKTAVVKLEDHDDFLHAKACLCRCYYQMIIVVICLLLHHRIIHLHLYASVFRIVEGLLGRSAKTKKSFFFSNKFSFHFPSRDEYSSHKK